MRLRLIKTYVTKYYGQQLGIKRGLSQSRQKRKESNLWQQSANQMPGIHATRSHSDLQRLIEQRLEAAAKGKSRRVPRGNGYTIERYKPN